MAGTMGKPLEKEKEEKLKGKYKRQSPQGHQQLDFNSLAALETAQDRRTEDRSGETRSPPARLTPSQHVVPKEVLLPDEDGHDDERVEVDALTQHPEVVGSGCVQRQHSQDLTAHLRRRTQGGA